MKNEPRRLILWANDSPLHAMESVNEHLIAEIEAHLREAEEDSCFLNDVIAYLRCLTGVCDWAGSACVQRPMVESWRKSSMDIFDRMPDSQFDSQAERTEDRQFIAEVFEDLVKIVAG